MRQPQSLTFFIDRCLGNRHIVEKLRSAGITIEIHDDHFKKDAEDVDWLPEIGKRGWVVLTKDGKIGKNFLERIAVARSQVKMFVLASQNLSGKDMAETFLKAVVPMQEFARKHPEPFIAKIYRDGHIEMWKDDETLLEELKRIQEQED
jgi:predicted nuclease of predicted toxin-antitoxin system